MATLALILAVGGGAAVAAGKIKGNQIAKGTITGKQVKDHGLTGKELKNGSVSGAALEAAALANINAASVDGKSAGCGAGTVEYVGGCWETALTPNATWSQAILACSARGGVLPHIGALFGFGAAKGIALIGEWVDDLSYDSTVAQIRTFKVSDGSGIQNATLTETHGYRCVLPLVHA